MTNQTYWNSIKKLWEVNKASEQFFIKTKTKTTRKIIYKCSKIKISQCWTIAIGTPISEGTKAKGDVTLLLTHDMTMKDTSVFITSKIKDRTSKRYNNKSKINTWLGIFLSDHIISLDTSFHLNKVLGGKYTFSH